MTRLVVVWWHRDLHPSAFLSGTQLALCCESSSFTWAFHNWWRYAAARVGCTTNR